MYSWKVGSLAMVGHLTIINFVLVSMSIPAVVEYVAFYWHNGLYRAVLYRLLLGFGKRGGEEVCICWPGTDVCKPKKGGGQRDSKVERMESNIELLLNQCVLLSISNVSQLSFSCWPTIHPPKGEKKDQTCPIDDSI